MFQNGQRSCLTGPGGGSREVAWNKWVRKGFYCAYKDAIIKVKNYGFYVAFSRLNR